MKKKILLISVALTISNFAYASNININRNGASGNTDEVQIANIATQNNELSQASMLQLSQDIGTMADRINQMADKIVKTQEIQSENLQVTQGNILKA